MPGVMAALPGVPLKETVEGPSMLYLGDFVQTPLSPTPGRVLAHKGGLLHRFGMDDESTGALLRELLAASPERPDLTVAYFADNDYRSHEVGPVAALPVIERVDRMLGAAFDAAEASNGCWPTPASSSRPTTVTAKSSARRNRPGFGSIACWATSGRRRSAGPGGSATKS